MVHEGHFLPEIDKMGHFFPEQNVRAHLKFIYPCQNGRCILAIQLYFRAPKMGILKNPFVFSLLMAAAVK